MSDTFWTAASAIGTVAAFGVFTWQSVLTRGTLRATQDAVLESVRARLDTVAPTVNVLLAAPPWRPNARPGYGGMPVQPWPVERIFEFPEKQGDRVVLQQLVTVTNASGHHVEVTLDGDLYEAGEDSRLTQPPSKILGPGEHIELHLMNNFTIAEYAENYHAQEEDQPLPHRVTATISVHDDRDNGTTDEWRLCLTGCPYQPHSTRDSTWVEVPFNAVEGEGLRSLAYDLLPPRRRIHWISRAAGRRVPDPGLS